MISPRPWKVEEEKHAICTFRSIVQATPNRFGGHACIVGAVGYESSRDGTVYGPQMSVSNAEHIVHCVNLFDDLVRWLTAMCDLAELDGGFDDDDGMRVVEKSRETLEKARSADA